MLQVELRNIHMAFKSAQDPLPVLDGVTFEAASGKLVSILGPSGCGKSTLLNILSGLITPDQGEVFVGGGRVTGRPGTVAYMPQKDLLLPWRNVLDNAVVGLEVAGVPKEQAYRSARALVPLFGLCGFENTLPSRLSGGMRQRAALMRTVLLDRPVMALDEPFGALDAFTRRQMQVWLSGVLKRLGRTVLMVTHDVDEALVLSDSVVVLSRRPARVMERLDLPEGFSRRVTDPAFAAMKEKLLSTLEGDSG